MWERRAKASCRVARDGESERRWYRRRPPFRDHRWTSGEKRARSYGHRRAAIAGGQGAQGFAALAFDAAREIEIARAGLHEATGEDHGLKPRAALAVYGEAGHGDIAPGGQGREAGDIAAGASGVAEDHVVDFGGREGCIGERGGKDGAAARSSMSRAAEHATGAADRASPGGDDHGADAQAVRGTRRASSFSIQSIRVRRSGLPLLVRG